MPGPNLLSDLMLQYALRGLYDWQQNTTDKVQSRARECLSNRIPSTDGELHYEFSKQAPEKFFPMPKSGYRPEIEHGFFLPRSNGYGVDGGWSFILFILLQKDNSLAFRFEPAQPTGCRHDYAHIQFCRKIGNNDLTPIGIPDWIPERDPAFPLPSSDPVKLFLLMATAVHGRSGGVKKVIVDIFQNASEPNKSNKYIDLLRKTLDE